MAPCGFDQFWWGLCSTTVFGCLYSCRFLWKLDQSKHKWFVSVCPMGACKYDANTTLVFTTMYFAYLDILNDTSSRFYDHHYNITHRSFYFYNMFRLFSITGKNIFGCEVSEFTPYAADDVYEDEWWFLELRKSCNKVNKRSLSHCFQWFRKFIEKFHYTHVSDHQLFDDFGSSDVLLRKWNRVIFEKQIFDLYFECVSHERILCFSLNQFFVSFFNLLD